MARTRARDGCAHSNRSEEEKSAFSRLDKTSSFLERIKREYVVRHDRWIVIMFPLFPLQRNAWVQEGNPRRVIADADGSLGNYVERGKSEMRKSRREDSEYPTFLTRSASRNDRWNDLSPRASSSRQCKSSYIYKHSFFNALFINGERARAFLLFVKEI